MLNPVSTVTLAMGALDKKIFSGVAIVSALLFVVSAVMLLANGGDIAADDNGTALYILIVSGLLTVVFGAALVMDRSSFVRTLSGGLAALTGILFLAVPFAGGSTGTLLAVASIVAAVTIIADMLALWVSRVYGAMYVAAVLAAVEIAMGIMYFVGSTQVTYHAIALIVFGVWLALSAYVFGFVKVESSVRTREVKEDLQTQRGERPQAKNKKATKKAKKPEKKDAVPKEAPKDEPKKAPKEEPKTEPKVEAPKEAPKEEPKAAQKPPAKSMDDFMKKLMSSENANRVKREAPKAEEHTAVVEREAPAPVTTVDEIPAEPVEPVVEPEPAIVDEVVVSEEPVEEPEPTAVDSAVAEEVVAIVDEEPVAEPDEPIEPEVEPEAIVEEPVDDGHEGSEPDAQEAVEVQVDEEPIAEVIAESEEVVDEEPAIADESPYEPVEEPVESIEPEVQAEVEAEEPVEEPEVVTEVEPAEPVSEIVEEPETEEAESQPDWSMVSHDASQVEEPAEEPDVQEEPVIEEPEVVTDEPDPQEEPVVQAEEIVEGIVEEPEVVTEVEPAEPVSEAVEPEYAAVEPEPQPEEPAAEPEAPEASETEPEAIIEEAPAEPVPEEPAAEIKVDEPAVPAESEDEVLGEDIYTDYSPEAVVRRAAWNKGLRCRRGYGEFNIPVAFVKGKVAVYVDSDEPDTTHDAALREMGWTILRYDASTVTDGKAQGDEIAAAVKANMRSAKAAAKKKSKK